MPPRYIGGLCASPAPGAITPCPRRNQQAEKRLQSSQPRTTTLFPMGRTQEALLPALSSETTFSELTATRPRWILESSPASVATSSASRAPATGHNCPAQEGVAASGD